MGGIIILSGILIGAIAMFFYYYSADVVVAKRMLPLIIATFGFGIVGFIDDFKKLVLKDVEGLKPAHKMFGLLVVSVIFVVYLIKGAHIDLETYIPFMKIYITLPKWIYIPFTITVMLAATNAVNLTDGIDGLASTVTAIIVTFFTVVSMVLDIKEVTVFGSIVTGSCLGFLMFNLNPAKVFMGDTGSLALRRSYISYCNLYESSNVNTYSSWCLCNRNVISNNTSGTF